MNVMNSSAARRAPGFSSVLAGSRIILCRRSTRPKQGRCSSSSLMPVRVRAEQIARDGWAGHHRQIEWREVIVPKPPLPPIQLVPMLAQPAERAPPERLVLSAESSKVCQTTVAALAEAAPLTLVAAHDLPGSVSLRDVPADPSKANCNVITCDAAQGR